MQQCYARAAVTSWNDYFMHRLLAQENLNRLSVKQNAQNSQTVCECEYFLFVFYDNKQNI